MFSVKGESGSFLRRTGVTWEFRDVVRFQGKQICDCSRPAYVINLVKRNKFQPGTRERLRAFLIFFFFFFFFWEWIMLHYKTNKEQNHDFVYCTCRLCRNPVSRWHAGLGHIVKVGRSTYRINTFWFVVFMNSFHRVGKVMKVLWWVRHDRL